MEKIFQKVTCVTSMSKSYYDLIGKVMIDSFANTWKDFNLVVYTEDDLELNYPNIKVVNIDCCDPALQEYLDYIGDHSSRGFAYKVFSWIHCARNCSTKWLLWLDADSCCIRTPDEILFKELLPENSICAYMKTIMYKDKKGWKGRENCDSAIISFDTTTDYSKEFVNEFERLYTSKEIDNRELYPKPNDTHAFIKCINDAQQQGHTSYNLNPNDESLSPIKETILGEYFRHFKAGRKDKTKIHGVVNKLISSTNKLKDSPTALAKRIERVERRFRNG